MAYTPTVWVDGVTPVNAANLNKLENGLAAAVGIPADVVVPAASYLVRNKLLVGDAQPVYRQMGDGKLEWGVGGSTAPSVNLYRSGGGNLKTDNTLDVAGDLYVSGALLWTSAIFDLQRAAGSRAIEIFAVGDVNDKLEIYGDGKMQWGNGTAVVDTNLYRSAAGVLKSDGVILASKFGVQLGTANAILIEADGRIYFGAAADTDLYRNGVNTLKTDGYLQGLRFTGTDASIGYHYSPAAAAGYALYSQIAGEANPRYALDANGKSLWGPGGSTAVDTTLGRASAGVLTASALVVMEGTSKRVEFGVDRLGAGQAAINFGAAADLNLYRLAAGYLATDQAFYAKDELCANYAKANQILLQANGRLTFSNGMDTHLYRAAAGVLKTDGSIADGGIGTSFPASPVDGQEWVLTDSLTAPTYAWRFKYVAGISDANKWLYIGGSPMSVFNQTGTTINTGGATSDDFNPVSLTTPRAGVYLARYTCHFEKQNAADVGGYGVNLMVAGVDIPATYGQIYSQDSWLTGWQHIEYQQQIAAAQVIKSRIACNGNARTSNKALTLTPLRLA